MSQWVLIMHPGRRTSSLASSQMWDAGSRGRLPLCRRNLSPGYLHLGHLHWLPQLLSRLWWEAWVLRREGQWNRKARAGNSSVLPLPYREQGEFPLNWASILEAKVKGECVSRACLATERSLGCTYLWIGPGLGQVVVRGNNEFKKKRTGEPVCSAGGHGANTAAQTCRHQSQGCEQ